MVFPGRTSSSRLTSAFVSHGLGQRLPRFDSTLKSTCSPPCQAARSDSTSAVPRLDRPTRRTPASNDPLTFILPVSKTQEAWISSRPRGRWELVGSDNRIRFDFLRGRWHLRMTVIASLIEKPAAPGEPDAESEDSSSGTQQRSAERRAHGGDRQ